MQQRATFVVKKKFVPFDHPVVCCCIMLHVVVSCCMKFARDQKCLWNKCCAIYFATVYVKLKELNFIIGKVKTSKIVLEQGRRCLRRNEPKKKTQFLFSNWFKMSNTNTHVVHKVNTFFFSVKFQKFCLTLFRGRLAI